LTYLKVAVYAWSKLMVTLNVPQVCLILLVGASGSGKSTFARQHFGLYEVISSDVCRALITDDPGNQQATAAAFHLVRYIARLRLAAGRLVVIDATNVHSSARKRMLRVGSSNRVPAVAVVLDMPTELCLAQNRLRENRLVPDEAVLSQVAQLQESIPLMQHEGFEKIVLLHSSREVAEFQITRS
jgi:protein phosphatase